LGRAGFPGLLSFEGDGCVVHHLRILTRAVLDHRISDGINALAGAQICAVREFHGFGELRAVLARSACPELFKNRVCRSGIMVEV
jgi:hypothetical protein